MSKNIVICSLLFFTFLSFGAFTQDNSALKKDLSRVSVDILSKQIFILREKGEEGFRFSFPSGSAFVFPFKKEVRTLKVVFSSDFQLIADGRPLEYGTYYIDAPGLSTFEALISGEGKRIYPLPLKIFYSHKSLQLVVEEDKIRYSFDSATAELGEYSTCTETLKALAILIHGRCNSQASKHKNADFCDLSCCQIYRGRQNTGLFDFMVIDNALSKSNFYFSSSNGGKIFSEGIFSSTGKKYKPVADILLPGKINLSSKIHPQWESYISRDEISYILHGNTNEIVEDIIYSLDEETLKFKTNLRTYSIAPEDFRLKINRVKGWNFLKSNNYSVNRNGEVFFFKGSGLGHGVGLSIDGALALCNRGFSAYEILEHYYPDIKYKNYNEVQYCQYVIFNSESGKILQTNTGKEFLLKRIPCGSIFKILVTLYLLEQRIDLISHEWTCLPENAPPLPDKCWNKEGHGHLNLQDGISLSCNIYFASLYDKIDRVDFYQWLSKFKKENSLTLYVPEVHKEKDWARLLSGLDFRCEMSILDAMKFQMLLFKKIREDNSTVAMLREALKNTFVSGTAKITQKDKNFYAVTEMIKAGIWGKTSTVIYGTNSYFSYGIFIGGLGSRGIVTVMRKVAGRDCALLSADILYKSQEQ